MVSASLVSVGSAVPAEMDQRSLWTDCFASRYAGSPKAERIWASSGITTRHGVADPRTDDVSHWGTAARMRRYVTEALPLGKEAVTAALAAAGLAASDIGLFAVASCTGYATPGVDILLARDLGMGPEVQRLMIGHMGCYAALPGLGAVADFVAARSRPAVLLCSELTSLHVQPAADDVQQMVAHALFSDAVSATVLLPDSPGLAIVDVVARTDVEHSADMTWDVTDLGFAMGLSPRVPDVLALHVRDVVLELLGRNGLGIGDITSWAVHPGGPRILDVAAEQLGLSDDAMAASRGVLRDYGNCSSATVLLILERLLAEGVDGPSVVMAFGPGLTLYAALLMPRS